jgi:hypothetical protein
VTISEWEGVPYKNKVRSDSNLTRARQLIRDEDERLEEERLKEEARDNVSTPTPPPPRYGLH